MTTSPWRHTGGGKLSKRLHSIRPDVAVVSCRRQGWKLYTVTYPQGKSKTITVFTADNGEPMYFTTAKEAMNYYDVIERIRP